MTLCEHTDTIHKRRIVGVIADSYLGMSTEDLCRKWRVTLPFLVDTLADALRIKTMTADDAAERIAEVEERMRLVNARIARLLAKEKKRQAVRSHMYTTEDGCIRLNGVPVPVDPDTPAVVRPPAGPEPDVA